MQAPDTFVCPFCGCLVFYEGYFDHYSCASCKRKYKHNGKWFENEDILDVMYENPRTAVLSNLFPHTFNITALYECHSIEGFLRSLTIKEDCTAIKELCGYWGMPAYKVREILPDWRETQTLYFGGEEFLRNSDFYQNVISMAYDVLFEQSSIFRLAIGSTKEKKLIHSIGCNDKTQTLMTAEEYIAQLERLRDKL